MDGFLTAIKSAKQEPDHSLATVETTRRSDALTPSSIIGLDEDPTPNQIIDVLKSQPSSEQISAALAALDPFDKSKSHNVDIRVPGPVSAQILQTLVSTTIPDHWASVGNDKKVKSTKPKAALLRCLSSVAGIGSLVARLRTLILSARASSQQTQGSSSHSAIQDILSVLAALLEPKDFLFRLYGDNSSLYDNHTRQKVSWNELVSLVASGKIVSTAAEAFTVANQTQSSSVTWVGDGRRYASWLGVNISHFISKLDVNDESGWTFVATLTERALSLGYPCKSFFLQTVLKHTF
jgi:telomere length regulation protein